jgi:hypothetical protein
MNNGSLTQPANNNCPASLKELTKRLPKPVEIISEFKQIDEAPQPDVINESNNVEVVGIDRLMRKSGSRRSRSTARIGK